MRNQKQRTRVMHKTVNIDGLDIFYREAGSPENPTVLLLRGFPTSSQMFRNLMPQMASRYHLVAPDYPGFGESSSPAWSNSSTPLTTSRMSWTTLRRR